MCGNYWNHWQLTARAVWKTTNNSILTLDSGDALFWRNIRQTSALSRARQRAELPPHNSTLCLPVSRLVPREKFRNDNSQPTWKVFAAWKRKIPQPYHTTYTTCGRNTTTPGTNQQMKYYEQGWIPVEVVLHYIEKPWRYHTVFCCCSLSRKKKGSPERTAVQRISPKIPQCLQIWHILLLFLLFYFRALLTEIRYWSR